MSRKNTPPPDDPTDPLFTPANTTREPGDDSEELLPKRAIAVRPEVEIAPNTFVGASTTAKKADALGAVEEYGRESSAVAAQIRAQVQGRIVQAIQRPRSIEDVRTRILIDCKRPNFARTAIYKKPVGRDQILGLSIRFAETAIRHMGNIATETITIYEDSEKRVVRIAVVDLESNTSHSRDITLLKVIERSTLKDGQQALGQRLNSQGRVVYLVTATEDEILTKEAAARSKVLRNEGLRLVPGDILDEAFQLCKATSRDTAAKDPDKAWKDVADGYVELGIKPADLSEYLGCDLAAASPAQVEELRLWYVAIRDGDTTWSAILSAKLTDIDPDGAPALADTSRLAALKADAVAKAAARKGKP